jgi:hypothetical protein
MTDTAPRQHTHRTPGLIFRRLGSTLVVSWWWAGGRWVEAVEIVRVGVSRYAIRHGDDLAFAGSVEALLAHMGDYRRKAAHARYMQAELDERLKELAHESGPGGPVNYGQAGRRL